MSRSSQTLAYMRLFRLPNVFTAIADITMGFLFVRGSLEPLGTYLCLLSASCLLYSSGMVLNDVVDVDIDSKLRPQRPIPSGQISLNWAKQLAYGMLALGVAMAWLAGFIHADSTPISWRSGAVAIILAIFIHLHHPEDY